MHYMSESVKTLLESLGVSSKYNQVMDSRATEVSGESVVSLDLSFCDLKDLADGAFEGLQDLKQLYLGYNKLGSLTVAKFSGLESLKLLSLYTCELDNIPSDLFASLKNLEWLDLRENKLSKIPSSVGDLSKLNYLYLQNNTDLDFGDEFDFNRDYHSKKDVGKFFESFTKYSSGGAEKKNAAKA